jgi:tRNA pseudouridine55 synthase
MGKEERQSKSGIKTMRRSLNGILLVDKTPGLTSNGVLQRAKRLFNAKKAGHTGSLDPIATGMLPICFGEATKFSQFLLDSNKAYRVTAKLGVTTTTGDTEGEVLEIRDTQGITEAQIKTIIPTFLGEIQQVPPMYSALKHQGRPLYELARQGIEIERPARTVTIYEIAFEGLQQDELTLHVRCSKGTYIRTLVEDIGKLLGCGAHVCVLRRTEVTPYHGFPMLTLEQLDAILSTSGLAALDACLLPMETAVQAFPIVQLSTESAYYVRTGQSVRAIVPANASLVQLIADDTGFMGIGEALPDGRVKPHRLVQVA